jgi:hypothetical protein
MLVGSIAAGPGFGQNVCATKVLPKRHAGDRRSDGRHQALERPRTDDYRYRIWFQRWPISDRMMITPLKNWT